MSVEPVVNVFECSEELVLLFELVLIVSTLRFCTCGSGVVFGGGGVCFGGGVGVGGGVGLGVGVGGGGVGAVEILTFVIFVSSVCVRLNLTNGPSIRCKRIERPNP